MIILILQKSQRKAQNLISQGQVLVSVELGLEPRFLQLQISCSLPSVQTSLARLLIVMKMDLTPASVLDLFQYYASKVLGPAYVKEPQEQLLNNKMPGIHP